MDRKMDKMALNCWTDSQRRRALRTWGAWRAARRVRHVIKQHSGTVYLRTGFDVPEAFEDGFSMVQLKALTLLSPDAALKIECTAMQSSQQRSVHELLKEKLPGPLEGQWAVTAAQVNLYYPPEPGRTRAKVVTIEVTSKGRLNLHKFDAKMQAQLEGYLVAVGILQKGQTLSAQEHPPEADAISSSSAFED